MMAAAKALVLRIGSPVGSLPSRNPSRAQSHPFTTVMGDLFRTSALLTSLSSHVNRNGTGGSYTKLHFFVVPNGTPFCNLVRAFRGVVSAATGTGRGSEQGVEVDLEVVRMAGNEQFPSLISTLYPGNFGYVVEAVWYFDDHVVGV